MPSIKHIFTVILFALMITHDAYSWGKLPMSDQTVVERAELIVVGRIMPASIKRIDHPGGTSHEHHAMLEIVETLKGSAKTTAVKIIIHFGLYPVTGRYVEYDQFDDRHGMPDTAKDAIEIYDSGSGLDGRISGDIREPHIWLLSTKNPGYTTPDSTEFPGIWEPGEIQTVSKREALKKWITPEPPEPQATPIIRPLHQRVTPMSASIVQQLSTYPVSDWLSFSGVMLFAAWIGGCGGAVVAHFIICGLVYLSDAKQIMSQPGGDLDMVFWMGFLPRMISINLLLTCVVALPTIFARKPILRFDSWAAAFWSWRLTPLSATSMATSSRS